MYWIVLVIVWGLQEQVGVVMIPSFSPYGRMGLFLQNSSFPEAPEIQSDHRNTIQKKNIYIEMHRNKYMSFSWLRCFLGTVQDVFGGAALHLPTLKSVCGRI